MFGQFGGVERALQSGKGAILGGRVFVKIPLRQMAHWYANHLVVFRIPNNRFLGLDMLVW
jgi:hypothetical protein